MDNITMYCWSCDEEVPVLFNSHCGYETWTCAQCGDVIDSDVLDEDYD